MTMKRILRWLMGVLLICGLWMFVACTNVDSPVVEPETGQLQDGEWTGSGEGRSGTIIVKVTVENHQVTKVTVVSQSESSFAQETIYSLCKSAVGRTAEMSVEVDGITGATLTSTGVIDAINMALEMAMGKHVDKDKTYKDGTCDIIVVGAGGAGLSAAVAAAETAGSLKIIVLEKQHIIGGNTNSSTGGINAVETDIQKGLGIEDSKQLFYDDIMKGGKYENIPSLVENLVEHAPVTISWLTGLGADLSDVGLMGGSSVKRTHRPKGGTAIGPHLMKVLNNATTNKNIEIRTSNKVTGLLSAVDGSVTGVKVQNANGSTYSLTAKAVIIATGGFGANLEMVTNLQPDDGHRWCDRPDGKHSDSSYGRGHEPYSDNGGCTRQRCHLGEPRGQALLQRDGYARCGVSSYFEADEGQGFPHLRSRRQKVVGLYRDLRRPTSAQGGCDGG